MSLHLQLNHYAVLTGQIKSFIVAVFEPMLQDVECIRCKETIKGNKTL